MKQLAWFFSYSDNLTFHWPKSWTFQVNKCKDCMSQTLSYNEQAVELISLAHLYPDIKTTWQEAKSILGCLLKSWSIENTGRVAWGGGSTEFRSPPLTEQCTENPLARPMRDNFVKNRQLFTHTKENLPTISNTINILAAFPLWIWHFLFLQSPIWVLLIFLMK